MRLTPARSAQLPSEAHEGCSMPYNLGKPRMWCYSSLSMHIQGIDPLRVLNWLSVLLGDSKEWGSHVVTWNNGYPEPN